MSACPLDRCNGTGFLYACVEPSAGLAGYDSWPCDCAKREPAPRAAALINPIPLPPPDFAEGGGIPNLPRNTK